MINHQTDQKGFTLVELIVAVFIMAVASLGVISMFEFSLKVISETKAKVGAITIGNEIGEMIHNLPYNKVGTQGGIIPGPIPQEDTVTLNNIEYSVKVSIDYHDDPFDGTVALGTDELGNDYKKIRIAVSWLGHFGRKELVTVTTIAPKGIESDEGSGVLWINVFNAQGEPVPNAQIHIVNNQIIPPINDSSHQTNDQGYYYSSVPAANSSYQITITKDGYSSDYTCAIDPGGLSCSDSEGNPDPQKPNVSVIEGELVETSFVIDILTTLTINTVSQTIPTEWLINTDGGSADQFSPASELGPDGNYYFVWQDFRNFAARIYGQNYNQQTNQWVSDKEITTNHNQGAPDITLDQENIYYVWHDDRNGNQDIFVGKYNHSGQNLWGNDLMVNTDGTYANQQHPKIVFNASSTAPAVYIAWKDERAGSGRSDIYLQKIDSAGNPVWLNEIKVNLNSSSMYQAADSYSWNFDNGLNYVCDNGPCDSSTKIEVTNSVAKLVPIKTCGGTANSCDSFLTGQDCLNQNGCAWDDSGPCEGTTCDCSKISEENQCNYSDNCSWQSSPPSCYGTSCSCGSIGNRTSCQSTPGCSWFWFFCYGNPGCNCGNINNEPICVDADCNWGSGSGSCSGSCSCPNLDSQLSCQQSGCNWDDQGPCSGAANDCQNFDNQTSCLQQSGCEWTDSSEGYPTDQPNIYSIESLTINNLLSWDSFTEMATKNGGEIYYQLSDDNGTSWRYWNGANWAIAGANDYNPAETINDNIDHFPTTRGKIMFKAFLASNGTQQIELDQINIGFSYTTSGGGYSQSVDLAVDDQENVYIVWEDYQIDNYDIFIQKVDANGNILWPNDIRVNTLGIADQNNPSVTADNNNQAIIVWQDGRNGDNDIYAQKISPEGSILWSNDATVSNQSGSVQENPKANTDETGNIYIVWQDGRNGDNDIYAQKISPEGSILWSKDIRVNSITTGDQKNPDLLINNVGNLVISWQDNQNGDYDIMAAEYPGDPDAYTNTANVPLIITGEKRIGKNPEIFKYQENHSTNASGQLILNSLEWDTYTIELPTGSGFDIVGTEPPLPIELDPGDNKSIIINLE